MEKRKILTSHGALAALASKRIVVGRFMTLADAVRDHEGRTAALPLGRRPHDEALYDRLARWVASGPRKEVAMPILDEPTPTEELQLPRLPGDATLHVPPGEAGLRDALQRLVALEEAIRLHEQATSHPAVPRCRGDHDLYRRLREDEQHPGSNGNA